MKDLIIEAVKTEEAELLSEISSQTFYDTFHLQNSKEDMELFLRENLNKHKMEEELSVPGNHFFFVKISNEISGYLKLTENENPVELKNFSSVQISRIYVAKEKIGSGVGNALMQFSISFAEKTGKQIIWLGVWEKNLQAIHFYKKFGFEKFNEHLFKLGEDIQTDWLMKKELK